MTNPPCNFCRLNDKPNCGNSLCYTNREVEDDKEWIAECGTCGVKNKATWKQAIEDGCSECGSHKISIYHKESL